MDFLRKSIRKIFNVNSNSTNMIYKMLHFSNKKKYIIAKIMRNKILFKYSIHVGLTCVIGEKLSLPHPIGIVLGEGVIIGNNCMIYQNVTIGKKDASDSCSYPNIEDDVIIYPNSVIIGGIVIGKGSIVAPNSVVLRNVAPNTVVAGNPAKLIKTLSN